MKKTLAVLALVMLLSVSASASFTELQGMGGMPVQLTSLDTLIYVYPSEILNFGNEINVEFGLANIAYTLVAMKGSTLGIALYPNPGLGAVLATTALTSTVAGGPSFNEPVYVFNLVYGLDIGKTGIGASITYGSDSTANEVKMTGGVADKDITGSSSMFLKIAAGATLDIGIPLDVAISIALPGYSSNPKTYTAPPALVLSNDSYEKLSGMNISLGARTKMDNMIFNLGIAYITEKGENLDWRDTNADGTAEFNIVYTSEASTINAELLGGVNIDAGKTIKMEIGSGLQFATTGSPKDYINNKITPNPAPYGTAANTGITLDLPVYFSAICKLNDMFSFTAGINKTVLTLDSHSNKTVDAATGKVVSAQTDVMDLTVDSDVNIATCLAGKFGDMTVQWLLNYDLIRTGPAVINGTGSDIGTQVALVYSWK